MRDNKNQRYVSLIFIVLFTIGFTLITIFKFMHPIREYILPPYSDCYQLLQNIDTIDNKIFFILLFYIAFFIIYFILFVFLLIKVIKQNELKNQYSTVVILVIFNALIMSNIMYIDFQVRKTSVWWCENTRDICYTSYKTIHKIDSNSTYTPTLEDIKPCFLDTIPYLERAEHIRTQK